MLRGAASQEERSGQHRVRGGEQGQQTDRIAIPLHAGQGYVSASIFSTDLEADTGTGIDVREHPRPADLAA
jgi:hypothetical protein